MKKKVLLVAMVNSVHVARWINQFDRNIWDVHLFSSIGGVDIYPHSEIDGVTFHCPFFQRFRKISNKGNRIRNNNFFKKLFKFIMQRYYERNLPDIRVKRLRDVISLIAPDIIHSLEIQAAGYLTLDAKSKWNGSFPLWIATNWGSDIFLFGRLQEHKNRIAEVLNQCDYYSCECARDAELAIEFGFTGKILPIFPNTGGFDLQVLKARRDSTPTSQRKVIVLKGYQNWAGRALVGLRALGRCNDILEGYTVAIYSAAPDVLIAAELFTHETGIPVKIIPNSTPHHEMLSLHALARISIGISISDAISTSLLEAMVMGSFPIQSCTACGNEWIEHGLSGMIVPPEDPDIIEMAIRTALLNDELVDQAARINWQTSCNRLDGAVLKQSANDMYTKVIRDLNDSYAKS